MWGLESYRICFLIFILSFIFVSSSCFRKLAHLHPEKSLCILPFPLVEACLFYCMKYDSVEKRRNSWFSWSILSLELRPEDCGFTAFPVPSSQHSGPSSCLGNLSCGRPHLLQAQHTSVLRQCGSPDPESTLPLPLYWATCTSTVSSTAGHFFV